MVIGGVVLAISIFLQVIDWKIDYTATMGQLFRENILASTIFHAPTANRLVLPQGSCIKSTCSGGNCSYYYFSDSLSSGTEVDNFNVTGLTPGKKFTARIDNDIPGNRCNPNTYLTAYNNSDDNSSRLGNGFASALRGTVSGDGSINLDVRTANGGARGEDRGSYELHIEVYDESEPPPDDFIIVGGSGGGGFGSETSGRTQNDPVLPGAMEQDGWQVFRNVPGCRWYDPTTSDGFEFQALDDTLFTEILDFPDLGDNQFNVSVGDTVVGSYSPGQNLDFVSLFGQGVSNFKITGINSKGPTEETAFPIQLAFNDRIGSFKMRSFSETFLDKTFKFVFILL
ncbi:hypothetical protein WA1_34790 [Scytonema hofmannii PCC 7110]|uniref:Uncharacterized protein n=1 Tax=Scytonema hofmannii PCC 7110 TaxID=128403 RepID=A0A139X354_9CYAN|nr:hypothetical protein [Scytonema hofmannii]KYC39137.1 hypothetical protein WA1_34790 [Scytonema hofmannii PCC 7110]